MIYSYLGLKPRIRQFLNIDSKTFKTCSRQCTDFHVHAEAPGKEHNTSKSYSNAGTRQSNPNRRPGGNRQTTAVRGPTQQQPPRPTTPRFPYLIVVEGYNDMKAVKQAVNGDVFVLGTATHASYDRILDQLQEACKKYKGILVLTDPDVAGRQARNLLDTKFESCWHAFVPVAAATAQSAIRSKEAGNVGVEHASPQAIIQALKTARKSDPTRSVFTREQLIDWGLIAPMHERGGQVTERRQLVTEYLGLGPCDGKQLLRQLNRYGFSEEVVTEAKTWAQEHIVVVEEQ